MGETNDNWWTKVENSDGVVGMSMKEQITIDFLNANHTKLPPERFAKLVEQTIEIIKRTDIQEHQIRDACEKELERLRKDRSVWEITRAMTSNVTAKVDQLLSGDKKIQVFENGENINKTVHEFEEELRTKDILKVSSLGIANYLEYLHSQGHLTPETLIRKFSGANLQRLGALWNNGGNKSDGKNSLLAYKYLRVNDMGYIIDIITKLSTSTDMFENIASLKTPKEQEMAILLLQERSSVLKERFKKELRADLMLKNPSLKEVEVVDIVDMLLCEVLKHKGIKGLPLIYKTFDDYNKKYRVSLNIQKTTAQVQNISKTDAQLDMMRTVVERSGTKDPQKRAELDKKIVTLTQEKTEARLAKNINDGVKPVHIQELISGKKTIEQVVAELRKEDKDFDQEYRAWEKEKTTTQDATKKKRSMIEEADTKGKQSEVSDKGNMFIGKISEESLNNAEIGTVMKFRVSRDPKTPPIKATKTGASKYSVNIAGNTINMFSSELPGHIKSCRLLQNTGLEAMMHIKPSSLTDIMQACSKDGNQVDDSNGDFGAKEQILFLRAMTNTLGIKIQDGVGISTLRMGFKSALSIAGAGNPQEGFKKLAQARGFMNDVGVISPKDLKAAILAQKTT